MNRDIFKPRVNLKPYEYPELVKYADAINNAFWVVSEFNFTEDIQDFKVKLTEEERGVIERCMLAISQIEVNVKTFWGELYNKMPKPEVAIVGATFSESEVRHSRAYSHLLEVLGLNDQFESLIEVPEIKGRIRYLNKYKRGAKSNDMKIFTKSVMLFSMFVEHVSLFSQFLIIMSFNKEKNLLKGISNVVEATSLEEELHGSFGVELINIIREENPNWFGPEMEAVIQDAVRKAYDAEMNMLDWIYGNTDLDFLPRETVGEFVKSRFNTVLKNSGFRKVFRVNATRLEPTEWFEVQLKSNKEDDFFYKNSVAYNKSSKSITEEDLF